MLFIMSPGGRGVDCYMMMNRCLFSSWLLMIEKAVEYLISAPYSLYTTLLLLPLPILISPSLPFSFSRMGASLEGYFLPQFVKDASFQLGLLTGSYMCDPSENVFVCSAMCALAVILLH